MKVREFNKQLVFPKDNITRTMKMMRDRIITLIPFLSFFITKETTKSRSRFKFVVLMRLKKNETRRSKRVKVMIVRGWPKKTLIRSLIINDSAWNAINSMNNMKSSFTLKWGRKFGRKKKSTNSVKNMTKFSFGLTIDRCKTASAQYRSFIVKWWEEYRPQGLVTYFWQIPKLC